MKRVFSAIIVFALVFWAVFGILGCSDEYIKRTEYVFSDSGLTLSVMAMGGDFDKAFDEMLAVLEVVEKETNVNLDSNFSENEDGFGGSIAAGNRGVLRINTAGAGEMIEIGFYTFDMIRLAKDVYKKTDGAFNIAAYPLVYLWAIDALGYEDSVQDYLRGLPYGEWRTPQSFAESNIKRSLPLPDFDEVLRVRELCDLDKLTIFEEDGRYFAKKEIGGLMIDLGGISKGYAADLCADIARNFGLNSALIEISGNIVLVGNHIDDDESGDWQIGIKNARGGIFCAYAARANTTAVTSGDYERFRRAESGGKEIEICHIIDAANGLPYSLKFDGADFLTAEDRVVSVSVLSGKSALADAYTTAACVMGLEKAVDFFASSDIDAIVVTEDERYAIVGDVELVHTDKYAVFKEYTRVFED